MNILHITDLHINDINSGSGENLRKAQYKPFLNQLISQVHEANLDIDFLFLTGDFINKGKVINYEHCAEIIEYLCSKLNLNSKDVFTCPGNHDVNFTNEVKPLNDYFEFSKKYNQATLVSETKIIKLYRIDLPDKKCFIAAFNSLYGTELENIPCKLNDSEIDDNFLILETADLESPLFCLSHYPMDQPKHAIIQMEDPNWIKNHFWQSGYKILDKLKNYREDSITVFFHGDAHFPDFWSYSDSFHVLLTGMIGGNQSPTYEVDGETVAFNNYIQCRILNLKQEGVEFFTFNYDNRGFEFDKHVGSWSQSISGPRLVAESSILRNAIKTQGGQKKNPETKTQKLGTIQCASTDIQKIINDVIISDKLYSFGNYSVNENWTSLGWIEIDLLLKNDSIFSGCVDKAALILNDSESGYKSKERLLIGIGFWGNTLSSHVSILTSIMNLSISRVSKDFSMDEINEKLEIQKNVNKTEIKEIVFFIDVISTGTTIYRLSNFLKELFGKDVKFYAISLLCDPDHVLADHLTNLHIVYSFCTNVKIPVIETIKLPSEQFLPKNVDLIN